MNGGSIGAEKNLIIMVEISHHTESSDLKIRADLV